MKQPNVHWPITPGFGRYAHQQQLPTGQDTQFHSRSSHKMSSRDVGVLRLEIRGAPISNKSWRFAKLRGWVTVKLQPKFRPISGQILTTAVSSMPDCVNKKPSYLESP